MRKTYRVRGHLRWVTEVPIALSKAGKCCLLTFRNLAFPSVGSVLLKPSGTQLFSNSLGSPNTRPSQVLLSSWASDRANSTNTQNIPSLESCSCYKNSKSTKDSGSYPSLSPSLALLVLKPMKIIQPLSHDLSPSVFPFFLNYYINHGSFKLFFKMTNTFTHL